MLSHIWRSFVQPLQMELGLCLTAVAEETRMSRQPSSICRFNHCWIGYILKPHRFCHLLRWKNSCSFDDRFCCTMKPIVFLLYLEKIKRFGFLLICSSRWRVHRNDILVNCHFGILRCCTAEVLSLREGFDDVTLWSDSVPFAVIVSPCLFCVLISMSLRESQPRL